MKKRLRLILVGSWYCRALSVFEPRRRQIDPWEFEVYPYQTLSGAGWSTRERITRWSRTAIVGRQRNRRLGEAFRARHWYNGKN